MDTRPYVQRWPRSRRKRAVREPWDFPILTSVAAVVLMQKVWRGSIVRRNFRNNARGYLVGQRVAGHGGEALVARCLERLDAGKAFGPLDAEVVGNQELTPDVFRHFCTTIIQAWWRGSIVSKWYARNHVWPRIPVYQIAALEIQDAWKIACERLRDKIEQGPNRKSQGASRQPHPALLAQTEARTHWSKHDRAAHSIQKFFWRRSYRAVFAHFRLLLGSFAGKGDPRSILRAINPREAELLDAASRCRVMLRLGGTRFPPSTYYLIVSEGPVCDVGAFAPRQYHMAAEHGKRRRAAAAIEACARATTGAGVPPRLPPTAAGLAAERRNLALGKEDDDDEDEDEDEGDARGKGAVDGAPRKFRSDTVALMGALEEASEARQRGIEEDSEQPLGAFPEREQQLQPKLDQTDRRPRRRNRPPRSANALNAGVASGDLVGAIRVGSARFGAVIRGSGSSDGGTASSGIHKTPPASPGFGGLAFTPSMRNPGPVPVPHSSSRLVNVHSRESSRPSSNQQNYTREGGRKIVGISRHQRRQGQGQGHFLADGSGAGIVLSSGPGPLLQKAQHHNHHDQDLAAVKALDHARTFGWYQREEGCGWRPVAVQTLEEAALDPVALATARRKRPWHWSRLARRGQKQRVKKQRKKQWLLRMYKAGLAEPTSEQAASKLEEMVAPAERAHASHTDAYHNSQSPSAPGWLATGTAGPARTRPSTDAAVPGNQTLQHRGTMKGAELDTQGVRYNTLLSLPTGVLPPSRGETGFPVGFGASGSTTGGMVPATAADTGHVKFDAGPTLTAAEGRGTQETDAWATRQQEDGHSSHQRDDQENEVDRDRDRSRGMLQTGRPPDLVGATGIGLEHGGPDAHAALETAAAGRRREQRDPSSGSANDRGQAHGRLSGDLEDLEELLQWSHSLDFDAYADEWKVTGLSGAPYVPFSESSESKHCNTMHRLRQERAHRQERKARVSTHDAEALPRLGGQGRGRPGRPRSRQSDAWGHAEGINANDAPGGSAAHGRVGDLARDRGRDRIDSTGWTGAGAFMRSGQDQRMISATSSMGDVAGHGVGTAALALAGELQRLAATPQDQTIQPAHESQPGFAIAHTARRTDRDSHHGSVAGNHGSGVVRVRFDAEQPSASSQGGGLRQGKALQKNAIRISDSSPGAHRASGLEQSRNDGFYVAQSRIASTTNSPEKQGHSDTARGRLGQAGQRVFG